MRTSMECWECYSHTFGNLVKRLAKDEEEGYEIICRLVDETGKHFKESSPADVGTILNKVIMEYFSDPFKQQKQESNEIALKIFEKLRDVELTLFTAVKIALFGNTMDYSVKGWNPKDIDLNSILDTSIIINHIEFLELEIAKSKTILYLTDNAGEVILDYFLVKYLKSLGKKVILSPKIAPIQNDATLEDIQGTPILDIVDEVIPTAQAVGLDLKNSSSEFRRVFEAADLLIFKGMGYFENAFNIEKNSFFILKAKCHPVARFLGVEKGSNIVLGKKYRLSNSETSITSYN